MWESGCLGDGRDIECRSLGDGRVLEGRSLGDGRCLEGRSLGDGWGLEACMQSQGEVAAKTIYRNRIRVL